MFEKLKSAKGRAAATSLAVLALALAASDSDARAATVALAKGAEVEKVDDSAVRYYAATGQSARAEAEIKRLRALYPTWTPPEVLNGKTVAGGEDEDDLWELYAADKLDALRAAIDARRVAEPGWEPSADLREKFAAKMFRAKVVGLARDGRFAEIVQWLKASGAQLDGLDIDLLWTIAEAYQKAGQNDKALEIYKSILASNADPTLRLATVQKSMGALRMDEVEQLLAMAHKDASGQSEFAPIATDIARARISAFLHDERRQEVEDDDLKQFAAFARTAEDSNQPALLAWYYYKLKNYSPALDWFKYALERGGDAMVAHGLAHSLRFLGMKREAEEVAYAWREPLVNNAILFIDILETDLTQPIPPYIEPARLARYGEVAISTASGEGAQALAWYAYNSCQFDVALQWFERAVAWHPKEPTVYGYALTLRRLKKGREVIQLINRYDGLFPKVAEILFPDGRIHPPTPCEQRVQTARQQQEAPPVWNETDRPYATVQDPARKYVWGRVAGPGQGAYGASAATMPKISRAEFPIRVGPDNPLRFAPAGQAPIVNAPVGDIAPATPGFFAREPGFAFPLVARRVPGVGPMPYERYGFALLPGYNGVTIASSPTASEQIAPAGTLWSLEMRDGAALNANRAPLAAPRVVTRAPERPVPDVSAPAGADPSRLDPSNSNPSKSNPSRNG
jgi:tetratricopeptide (TPR) repeat protein